MKKNFELLVLILFTSLGVFSQTNDLSKKVDIQYSHAVETQANIGLTGCTFDINGGQDYKNLWGVGINEWHGIHFKPHFTLSAGLGVFVSKAYRDNEGLAHVDGHDAGPYNDCAAVDFSLGLNFKYIVLNRTWSPLLMVDFRALSATLVTETGKNLAERNSYCLFVPMRMLNFSVGAQYRFGDRQSVYAALGYEIVWSQLNLTVGVRIR